jgi:hypothetical protein
LEITSLIPGYLAASPVVWRVLSGPGASVFCGVELKLPLALLVVNTNGNNIFRGQ